MNRILLYLLGLFFLIGLSGCSTCTTCGALKLDTEVKQSLVKMQFDPELNYYFFGKEGRVPNVIIGLDKKYTLQSNHWLPVTNAKQQIPLWIETIDSPRFRSRQFFYPYSGFAINGSDGTRAGIWYGEYTRGKIFFIEPNIMERYPPQPSVLASQGSEENSRK